MDIVASVLQASANGATKTRVMYGAYLSYAQVKEYLGFMVERELLAYEEGSGTYLPTPTGTRLLRIYGEISDILAVGGTRPGKKVLRAAPPVVADSQRPAPAEGFQ